MVKNTKMYNIDNYNLKLTKNNTRYLMGLAVLLLLILIFIKNYDSNTNNKIYIMEKILVFMIIFILTIILSKNYLMSVIISIILFLLINLLMTYTLTMENFQNDMESDKKEKKQDDEIEKEKSKGLDLDVVSKSEPSFDKSIFNSDTFKKSTMGIQDLLKKVNGGIELKEDDLKETGKLGVESTKYSDDKNMNPLKQAQKEAYELIDTVNALKDTVNTLAPVLTEGRKLMDVFQNLKL